MDSPYPISFSICVLDMIFMTAVATMDEDGHGKVARSSVHDPFGLS